MFEAVERVFYDTVNDEEERLAVVLSSLEMIRNGTTTFLEAGTVLTPDAAAAGARTGRHPGGARRRARRGPIVGRIDAARRHRSPVTAEP